MDEREMKLAVSAVTKSFPDFAFSTFDFIQKFREQYPRLWKDLDDLYGAGGKGAGSHYTAFSRMAQELSALSRKGDLGRLDYRPAPDIWGNRVIRFWSLSNSDTKSRAEETETVDPEFREGSWRLRVHLQRERGRGLSKKKKAEFVREHGKLFCERCNLDPGQEYGLPIGAAVIEVHHDRVEVGKMAENHITRLGDLKCLCANCHRIVHAEINEGAK